MKVKQIQPYIFFDGRAEEAIEFYKKALGAKVEMLMRFKESPEPPPPGAVSPGSGEKIMHASLKIGDATINLSDGMAAGNPTFKGISLTFNVQTSAEADKAFAALSQGGQVQMPIGKTFFSPRFGMVADKFGVAWMVMADE